MEGSTDQDLSNYWKIHIIQISDIHTGLIVREKWLQKLIAKSKEAKPDILISTGELLDGESNNVQPLTDLVQQVNPQCGKYAIPENHEYREAIINLYCF